MKGGREHRVPLSAQAVAVLKALEPGEGPVFSNRGRPLNDMVLARLHRRMGYAITTHGFRSSFRDWGAERTNFPTRCWRWRSPMLSVTRLRPPTGAAICSRNVVA